MNAGVAWPPANRFYASNHWVGTVTVGNLHVLTSPTYALFLGEQPTAKSDPLKAILIVKGINVPEDGALEYQIWKR